MAPVLVDVRNSLDVRDVVHRAVQALAEGKLVAFPTEAVYGLVASALNEQAVARLRQVMGPPVDPGYALAIKSAAEALDYVPHMRPLCERLARRVWPGPVTLVVPDDDHESLTRQLPTEVRHWLSPDGRMRLRVPAHRLLLDVLRLMPGPLAWASVSDPKQPQLITAADVAARYPDDVDLVLDDGRSQFGQPASVVRIDDEGMHVVHAGVVSADTLRRLASMLILFVCTGNTCRSPMAEALCRKMLAERLGCRPDQLEDRGILIMSAGTSASAGGSAAAEAIQVMADMGADLAQHATQPVTDRLVRHADAIFTMTQGHREALVNHWPEVAGRTVLLRPDQADVADPIGGPRELYRRCAEQMEAAIGQRLDELELPESTA